MNKVYIVEIIKSDSSEIFKVRKSKVQAQLVKMHILAEITTAKVKYRELYGSYYDEDRLKLSDDNLIENEEDLYDKLVEQIYDFEMKNQILKITDIIISDHDVL